eukprot:g15065.t1
MSHSKMSVGDSRLSLHDTSFGFDGSGSGTQNPFNTPYSSTQNPFGGNGATPMNEDRESMWGDDHSPLGGTQIRSGYAATEVDADGDMTPIGDGGEAAGEQPLLVGDASDENLLQGDKSTSKSAAARAHLDKTEQHAAAPTKEHNGRRGPKKASARLVEAESDEDSDEEEGEVAELQHQVRTWSAKQICDNADTVLINEMRTCPASKCPTGTSGPAFSVCFITWGEKRAQTFSRKRVMECVSKVLKDAGLWDPADFALFVARERTVKGQKDWHFHVTVKFGQKRRAMAKIQNAFDDRGYMAQIDVIMPGKGTDALVPPLGYCLNYSTDKVIDSEPIKSENMKIPTQVMVAAANSRRKASKRPMTDMEAHDFLADNYEMLKSQTKAEMLGEVKTMVGKYTNAQCEKIAPQRFLRWLVKCSQASFAEVGEDVNFLINAEEYTRPLHEFLKLQTKCTCCDEGLKFETLCRIVDLQGDSAREKIGLWVHKPALPAEESADRGTEKTAADQLDGGRGGDVYSAPASTYALTSLLRASIRAIVATQTSCMNTVCYQKLPTFRRVPRADIWVASCADL